jgi:mono/diheme cytochrome c family protein
MLRSIAELAAYGTFAVLLAVASFAPGAGTGELRDDPRRHSPASSIAAERGALLFAVKGCIGCHVHAALPNARMQVSPDLTRLAGRAGSSVAGLDAPSYVRQSLREPGAYRAAGYTAVMPDLHLSDAEIESLSAFLLTSAR